MCTGSKRKPCSAGIVMEGSDEFGKKEGNLGNCSVLLELSAFDDLDGFRIAVEEGGHDIDETSSWYGRRIGSKKMGFVERTPLAIAATFGSKQVLSYILETGRVDVNRACGADGATPLHCAVDGGSAASPEVVRLLLLASANSNSLDANGNRPGDFLAPSMSPSINFRRKLLDCLLKGNGNIGEECFLADPAIGCTEEQRDQQILTPAASKDGSEKKEYPVDLSLPDIKNGIYGTDEFRMYTFKVKPCSRAYSHDWTECPFVHPGENARRRDPRKYHYSCVPCPEFRKGTCRQGDSCDYAHGIFECWLHPAQYRTRLCKDETGCSRRVCFFAHKPEELRPLYASTGSAVPSPRSFSNGASSLDMTSITPLALGSPPLTVPSTSTPPTTPSSASSPLGGSMWQNQPNIVPPNLQLPSSRLRTSVSARDMELGAELLGLEIHRRRQQQLMDEISGLSSPTSWQYSLANAAAFGVSSVDRSGEFNRLGGVKPTNLDDVFGSLDPTILSQLQGFSLDASASQVLSPTGMQLRQNMNQQLRPGHPTSLSSSPARATPSGPASAAVLNSRAAAFAKRSQSFIDRSAVNRLSGFSSPASSANVMPSTLSDWGSADGKLDWGIQKEELNKLRKSASFGFRSSGSNNFAAPTASMLATSDEPDVSWVQSLVKDAPVGMPGQLNFEEQHHQQCDLIGGGSELLPPWEHLYMEQKKQMVA